MQKIIRCDKIVTLNNVLLFFYSNMYLCRSITGGVKIIMAKKKDKNELYEVKYSTPNKKVVKEILPALEKPLKKKEWKRSVFWGRFIFIIGLFFVFGLLDDLHYAILVGDVIRLIVFGFISLFGFYKIKDGKESEKRLARYYRYMKVLESKKYAGIGELAAMVAKPEKVVLKDLQYMMDKGWFLEGHFDANKEQFILTDEVFKHYRLAVKGQEMREKEEREKEEKGKDERKKEDNQNSFREDDGQELHKVLKEGEAYSKKIHKLNDAILGDNISMQMDEIENNLISIFELLKRKPEKIDDIKKLMQYYLPMTVKILNRYSDFESEKIHSRKLEEGKREIEETLEKVKKAFANLRERLFQEDIIDVSTDLDVLEAMMSQEGLLDEGFKINN